jgi:periplasmic copper chaperone A
MNKLLNIGAGLLLALIGFATHAHSYKVGDIAIGHPYARGTAPGQPNGGAYLRLENHGSGDRLLSASAEVANRVELHESRMEGDVMRMRQLDAIEVPADKAVVLQPGGMHIMLVGLKAPLKKGDSFALTLKFEKAGEVKVDVKVEAGEAGPAAHKH